MAAFKDQAFHDRVNRMGDECESVFEDTYAAGFVRFGLNRPPLKMSSLPAVIRHTPDYLTTRGLVECQGHGGDQIAKFKTGKLQALSVWHHSIMRVDFFLWDSKFKRYGWVRLPDLLNSVHINMLAQFENDGNEYFAFPVNDLPMASGWIAHGEPLGVER